jgi:hypothetical protein
MLCGFIEKMDSLRRVRCERKILKHFCHPMLALEKNSNEYQLDQINGDEFANYLSELDMEMYTN